MNAIPLSQKSNQFHQDATIWCKRGATERPDCMHPPDFFPQEIRMHQQTQLQQGYSFVFFFCNLPLLQLLKGAIPQH